MGKKKKRNAQPSHSSAAVVVPEQLVEELEALSAIYGPDYWLLEDGMGCAVHVVPHPGEAGANEVQLDLECRCDGTFSAVYFGI